MQPNKNYLSRENDDRFVKQGIIAPITFVIIFIIFVYGALFVGLLGLSNWIIHVWSLDFFLSHGNFGLVMMVFLILFLWIFVVLSIAATSYLILKANAKPMQAKKVSLIIMLLLFHVFAMPVILWPMIRRNSPTLNKKYRQKLKVMAKGPVMQQRLTERRERLKSKTS